MLGAYVAYTLVARAGPRPAGLLGRGGAGRVRGRAHRRSDRSAAAEADLRGAGAAATRRDLRRRADRARRRAGAVGRRGPARPARPGLRRRGRASSAASIPDLRPAAARRRAARAAGAVVAPRAHPLRHADARRRPRIACSRARWASTSARCSPRSSRSARLLAGLAGALQLPREPANLGMDLAIIAEAFVVTVVGGLGSIPGAFRRRAADRTHQGALHCARHRRARRHRDSPSPSSRWSPSSS